MFGKKLKNIKWNDYNFEKRMIVVVPIGIPGMGKSYSINYIKAIL